MFRKILFSFTLCAGVLNAQSPFGLPLELRQRISELQLRDIDVEYEEKKPCVLVSGINQYRQIVAYVAVKYIGSGSAFHWTPFVALPLYPDTNGLKIEYIDGKTVVLQWNSNSNHVAGHFIVFNREHRVITVWRIPMVELIKLLEERSITLE